MADGVAPSPPKALAWLFAAWLAFVWVARNAGWLAPPEGLFVDSYLLLCPAVALPLLLPRLPRRALEIWLALATLAVISPALNVARLMVEAGERDLVGLTVVGLDVILGLAAVLRLIWSRPGR